MLTDILSKYPNNGIRIICHLDPTVSFTAFVSFINPEYNNGKSLLKVTSYPQLTEETAIQQLLMGLYSPESKTDEQLAKLYSSHKIVLYR